MSSLSENFKVKNGLTVVDSISAGGNLSASEGYFIDNLGVGTNVTGDTKFSVDGDSGNLFSVTDAITGIIFSVNDAAGLPIIEVESTSITDTITIGEYGTNAIVVSGANVGIGGATNSYKLDVVGDINASTNILSGGVDLANIFSTISDDVFWSASGNDIYNDNSGNVGIGIASPAEKLDVDGNALVRGDIVSRDAYPSVYVDHSGTVMGGIRADSTNKLELKTLTTAPLSFQVNASEKMRIISSGNVGIGTTAPSDKLDVVGNINVVGSSARIGFNAGDMAVKNEGGYKLGFQTYNSTSGTITTKMVLDTEASGPQRQALN
jgi:hypothetical protein